MSSIKLMMNVGKNTVSDYAIPKRETVSKNKNFEIRTYARNKYAMIKYQYVETENQDKKAKKSESKQGNDEVMKFVWKLMEYTQGSNEEKLCMKLIMPVFVGAETIERAYEGDQNKNLIEVTVFLSLPPEYQENGVEPPKPTDPTIIFEFIEGFKCFVGSFGGFASDDKFKEETAKLKENVKKENSCYNYNDNKVICISYDPPFKLINRTNEVLINVIDK